MKLKFRIATVCFFLTVAGLSLAAAQQPVPADENGGFEGRWWASPRAQARLGLSAEQTKQIEELTYQSGQRLIDCGAALSKARLELARLLQSDTLSESAIDRAVERVVEAQTAVFREETKTRAAVAQALTREQRVELMSWFERRARPLLRPGLGGLRRR
ncbi:MAG: periplasmic heavy metal sensor [Acidobacteriota bacterium]